MKFDKYIKKTEPTSLTFFLFSIAEYFRLSQVDRTICRKSLFQIKGTLTEKGTFQIMAGWYLHQPGQSTVGGIFTAKKQYGNATIRNALAEG
ncbi:MAG: hypothetical protein JSS98_19490 [Bacteroidetes bacterium]|nr:hypothetical protein [Bacteroidota bacterium]